MGVWPSMMRIWMNTFSSLTTPVLPSVVSPVLRKMSTNGSSRTPIMVPNPGGFVVAAGPVSAGASGSAVAVVAWAPSPSALPPPAGVPAGPETVPPPPRIVGTGRSIRRPTNVP